MYTSVYVYEVAFLDIQSWFFLVCVRVCVCCVYVFQDNKIVKSYNNGKEYLSK